MYSTSRNSRITFHTATGAQPVRMSFRRRRKNPRRKMAAATVQRLKKNQDPEEAQTTAILWMCYVSLFAFSVLLGAIHF